MPRDDHERLRRKPRPTSPQQIERKLDRMLADQKWTRQALTHIDEMVHRMARTLDEALAGVVTTAGKTDSLIALVKKIHDEVVELRQSGRLTPAQQAQIDQIADLSDMSNTKVEDAVNAHDDDPNTPPVIEPPEPFVQGTNPDGSPLVDGDGNPVDQNGNPDPNA